MELLTYVVTAVIGSGAIWAFMWVLVRSDKQSAIEAESMKRQNDILRKENERAKIARDTDPSKLDDKWLRPRD